MQYFSSLPSGSLNTLFFRAPAAFSRSSPYAVLRGAVGGLLYLPASHPNIAQRVLTGSIPFLSSLAICLEDAIGDGDRRGCMRHAMEQIGLIAAALRDGSVPPERLPLLFLRVKDNDMLEELGGFLAGHSDVVTGVILPKAGGPGLERGLELTSQIHRQSAFPFYAMPILESRALMETGDRIGLLHSVRECAGFFHDRVLNFRIGAADLCGLYGIRRNVDTPIYSVGVVASCIADIVRVFALDGRYTVSGPVWEYYTPRAGEDREEFWGLVREVELDLQNGLLGKTCIHPSQLIAVQACCTVLYEEFRDAAAILSADKEHSGVLAGGHHNKMNELRPHELWARKIMRRAEMFGIAAEHLNRTGFLCSIFSAGRRSGPAAKPLLLREQPL